METIGWIQVVPFFVALVTLFIEPRSDTKPEDKRRRKALRLLSAIAICCGITVVVYGQFKSRAEGRQREAGLKQQLEGQQKQISLSAELAETQKQGLKKADDLAQSQKQLIAAQADQLELATGLQSLQTLGLRKITNLGLNRHLSALEISYCLSPAQWEKIATVYDTQRPITRGERSYYRAPFIARRVADGWAINFAWTEVIENGVVKGWKQFSPITANQHENQAFAEMLREACLPLLIKWGGGTESDIEPWTDHYPSIVTISPSLIVLTVRPPDLDVYLVALRANPTLSLRTRSDHPPQLRPRSLDASVKFDEIIDEQWQPDKSDNTDNPANRLKPLFSNRHQLRVRFTD